MTDKKKHDRAAAPESAARAAGADGILPVQPEPDDQSGSTGRPTGAGETGPGKDTGQDRYGQTGFGGAQDRETIGQANYRKDVGGAAQPSPERSNAGSGRADLGTEDERRDRPSVKDRRSKD